MRIFRIIIGVIFIVASLLKIATLTNIIQISWLERLPEEPWAIYGIPFILIMVGLDLINQGIKNNQK